MSGMVKCCVGAGYIFDSYQLIKGQCVPTGVDIAEGPLKEFADRTSRDVGLSQPVRLIRVEEKDTESDDLHTAPLPMGFGNSVFPRAAGVAVCGEDYLSQRAIEYFILQEICSLKVHRPYLPRLVGLIVGIALTLLFISTFPLGSFLIGGNVGVITAIALAKWLDHKMISLALKHGSREVLEAGAHYYTEVTPEHYVVISNSENPGLDRFLERGIRCLSKLFRNDSHLAYLKKALNPAAAV